MLIDPEELKRYFRGESTPKEQERIKAWLAAGKPEAVPEWPAEISNEDEKEEIWTSIVSKHQHTTKRKRKRQIIVTMAAASLLFFMIGIGALYFIHSENIDKDSSLQQQFSAKPGQKIDLRLPDGSQVVLNSGSTIQYRSVFDDSIRLVLLEGEAYFSVIKNPDQPFVVQSKHSTIRVLGTTFNVSDYPDDNLSIVTVESGRVAVWNIDNTHTTLLNANQQATIVDNKLTKTAIEKSVLPSWRSGTLQLQEITLREAIPKIERWYGIEVNLINKEVGELTIKGSFKDKSLSDLMGDLSFLLPIQYRIDETKVIIY